MARTIKLKGAALRRYLHSVVAQRGRLGGEESRALAGELARHIASAAVKRIAWTNLAKHRLARAAEATDFATGLEADAPSKTPAKRPKQKSSQKQAPPAAPVPQIQAPEIQAPEIQAPEIQASEANASATAEAFDPYAFGLIPIYQREGGAALRTKLDTIASVDHLRKMARAQQIGLPANIRRGEVSPETVRDAIMSAVEKRIADRRAAAS